MSFYAQRRPSTLSLISVSLTALFVIPAICNAGTKPLMNAVLGDNKTQQKNPVSKVNFQGAYPAYHFNDFYNHGMKIGGL